MKNNNVEPCPLEEYCTMLGITCEQMDYEHCGYYRMKILRCITRNQDQDPEDYENKRLRREE